MTLAGQGGLPGVAVVVTGGADSGRSALGRALAAALRLPLLDLEARPNRVLDHRSPAGHRPAPSSGEGDTALETVAPDVVATTTGVVPVAPLHDEPTDGRALAKLAEAVAPAELRIVYLRGTDGPPPAASHIALDAALTPEQLLARVLRALGHRMAVDPANPLFGRPFEAVLFDLDGVLVDSTASVTRSWDRFAAEFGVSARALQENHGQPAQTLVERLLGPDRIGVGLARIEAIEVDDATTVEALPGAAALFASLPEHRRAVVTSGTPPIAIARLRVAGFPLPGTLVTADDVARGKPDPAPYLLAAQRLGVPPDRCLAVEDAPAGIASARAAGCEVLAITGTAPADELAAAALTVDGLDRIAMQVDADGVRLVFAQ